MTDERLVDENNVIAPCSNDAFRICLQVLERQEKLASNESFSATLSTSKSEDEEEAFILDPSMLTVQDIQLAVHIPRVTLQVSAVYLVPEAARSSDSSNSELPVEANVPLVKVCVEGVRTKASASNNPWVMRGTCSMDRLYVQMMQSDPSSITLTADDRRLSHPLPEPLLCLPRVTGTYSLTQTSTMGRSIGNSSQYLYSFSLNYHDYINGRWAAGPLVLRL